MKRTISKSELIALNPCDLYARLDLFGDRDRITLRQAIKAGATVPDILWVIARIDPNTIEDIAIFAKSCAVHAAAYADTVKDSALFVKSCAANASYADSVAYVAKNNAAKAKANASYTVYAACLARDSAIYAAYAAYAAKANAVYADYAATTDNTAYAVSEEKRQFDCLIKLFGDCPSIESLSNDRKSK